MYIYTLGHHSLGSAGNSPRICFCNTDPMDIHTASQALSEDEQTSNFESRPVMTIHGFKRARQRPKR